jgi:hypothetical protein
MALRLRDGVSVAEIEYGIALLDEDSGEYYNLNPTGALVLRTLLDGGTPAQAVQELTREYAVDSDSAGQDVEALVGELRSAGLVAQTPSAR